MWCWEEEFHKDVLDWMYDHGEILGRWIVGAIGLLIMAVMLGYKIDRDGRERNNSETEQEAE